MKLRRFAALAVAGSFLMSACGSDELPSKAEFIDSVKKSMESDMNQLEAAGLEKADAEKIFDDFLSCTYDKIKDNEQLLRDAADKSGDAAVTAELEKKAAGCVEDLTKAATDAAMANAGG